MKKAVRNFLILVLGDVGSKLLGFAAVAYIARVLGPDDFGLVNIGIAVLGYMVLFTSPGVHIYGTRAVAAGAGDEIEVATLITGLRLLISGILLAGVFILAAVFSSGAPVVAVVAIYALSLIPLSLSLDWYFQGKEMMGPITWSRIILNGVYLVLLLIVVRGKEDLLMVPTAFLVGNTVSSASLLSIFLKDNSCDHLRMVQMATGIVGRWKRLLLSSLPIGLGSTLGQVAFNFPPLLLGILIGTAVVGQYSAAMRIVLALMTLDRVVGMVFFPIVSRIWEADRGRLSMVSDRFVRMTMVLTLPACVLTFFFAPELIEWVYGTEYGGAVEMIRILIWFFFATSLNTLFLFGLMGVGRERKYARITLWGTLTQTALMLLLFAPLGVSGVASGFVVGEMLITFLSCREYGKVIPVHFFRSLAKPAFSAGIVALLLYSRIVAGLFPNLAIALVGFLLALILTGGINRNDVSILRGEI